MSWEQRNGCGAYYTSSHREDGRIVREYYGTGELGQLAADVDAIGRQARLVEREDRAAERDRIAAIEDPIVAFGRGVDLAVSCEWRATSGRPRSKTAGRSLPREGKWPAFLTAREWRTVHTVTQSGGSSPDWSRSIRHV